MTDPLFFRRLFPSPDDASAVAATCSRGSVPLVHIDIRRNTAQLIPRTAQQPRVELPYPAIDIAWCPFKCGNENASFLTASTSQPMQLWDVEDAEVRASYVAYNDSAVHVSPHTTAWLEGSAYAHIAGGYGGVEDKKQVRVFDVLRDGDNSVWHYTSPTSSGPVAALHCGPGDLATSLLLAGFLRHGRVDVVDRRHACPAAVLRGLRSGISSIRTHPVKGHLVYASARLGDDRILCWDLRNPVTPLSEMRRELRTQQHCDFAFVAPPSAEGHHHVKLVSASHGGGVMIFSDDALGVEGAAPVVMHDSVGTTSGLCEVSNGKVAVVIGERQFSVSQAGKRRKRSTALVKPSDKPMGMNSGVAHPRVDFSDSEAEEVGDHGMATSHCRPVYTEDNPNIVVLSV